MWNSLLSQIQDKIDDAVDLLQEDDYDGEYGSEEEKSCRHSDDVSPPAPEADNGASGDCAGALDTAMKEEPSAVRRADAQVSSMNTAPATSTPMAVGDGWEEESSQEEQPSGHAAESTLEVVAKHDAHDEPAPAAEGNGGGSSQDVLPTRTHNVSSKAEEGDNTLLPNSAGNSVVDGPSTMNGSAPDGKSVPAVVIPAPASGLGVSAEIDPEESDDGDSDTRDAVCEDMQHAATGNNSCGDAAAEGNSGQERGFAPEASGAEPVPPTTMAGVEGDVSPPLQEAHAQLLRFQKQLAEEMSNSAALLEEVNTLKRRLSETETSLVEAQKTLSAAGNAESQLSTLIEKLGREKERSKAAVAERNTLREQVAELEAVVEDYRLKEATWESTQTDNAQSQSSAQQHIAQLENGVRQRASENEELQQKLIESERARKLLATQLQESQSKHESAVTEMKEASSGALELAEAEVERLRVAARRISVEHDERIRRLERDLREANVRAHVAEERLTDIERGSVGSLRDLRSEVEDAQARASSLASQLHSVRSENADLHAQYSALKKARTAEEESLRERMASLANSVSTLTKENEALRRSTAAAKDQAQQWEHELGEQKRRCLILETTNAQLKASPTMSNPTRSPHLVAGQADDSFGAHRDPAASDASLAIGKSGNSPLVPAAAVPPRPSPFAGPSPFAMGRDVALFGSSTTTSSFDDTAGGRNRGRLEREIVRQAVEIERLKKVEEEATGLRGKLKEADSQYDLLLQLFGQLEEELASAKQKQPA